MKASCLGKKVSEGRVFVQIRRGRGREWVEGILVDCTYPPQSHKFRIRLPRNLIWLCSTSMVAPSRRTSLATKLLKMMLRMEDLPEPDLPIRRTFFFAGLIFPGVLVLVDAEGEVVGLVGGLSIV